MQNKTTTEYPVSKAHEAEVKDSNIDQDIFKWAPGQPEIGGKTCKNPRCTSHIQNKHTIGTVHI